MGLLAAGTPQPQPPVPVNLRTMKALAVSKFSGPDALQVQDWPDPQPAKGEVLVKVAAGGVNFADVTEVKRPQTYQVPRAEFDRILMERAREVGVDVRESHRVTSCEFTADAAIIDFTVFSATNLAMPSLMRRPARITCG